MTLLIVVALGVALGLMGTAFVIAKRIHNFSIVDIAWSLNFTPIAAASALLGFGLPAADLHQRRVSRIPGHNQRFRALV